jgi:pimeloyl-ACP methyl ester carboxylesterase
MVSARWLAAVLLLGTAALSPVYAQNNTPATTTKPPDYTTALGVGLEEIAYPYPVGYMPITINGKLERIAFMDVAPSGSSKGQTVVLLHGKNFWGGYWHETIAALTQAGYRVIVPDQIGFGKSSKPDDIVYSFDLLADNTRALLDYVKVNKASIVGHSMGGMVAVRFARAYPDRVNKLVLEDPIGLEDYRLKAPPRSTDDLIKDELAQTVEGIRKYRQAYFVNWLPAYERFVEVPARVRLSGEYARWARVSALTSQMIYQQPVRHEFSLIQPRTLLVIGTQDRTAIGKDRVSKEVAATMGQYPELGQAAVKDIPRATLVEIPDCGHIPHIEAETVFHEALLKFLAEK